MSQFEYENDYSHGSCTESDDDAEELTAVNKDVRKWLNKYYDELTYCYAKFRECGDVLFGRAYFQLGDFGSFVNFVHNNTYLINSNLLKPKYPKHVSSVGVGTRSKYWVSGF